MKIVSNYKLFIIAILLIILFISPSVLANKPDFELKSKSAILLGAESGRVVYQKNAKQQLPPASITKIMTMLLVMEGLEQKRIKLTDKVAVSEYAAKMGGSQIWLEPGEEMTVKTLLKAVAIVSANDACVALAEYLYGTEEEFIAQMNQKAKELGMKNTKFYNTNGLPINEENIKGNYTTAYDVALMSRELLKYEKILDYTSVWIDHIRNGKSFLRNTNELVRFYDGADGIKTGYTTEAGFCLSATAQRNNMRFVSVVMNAPNSKTRFRESKQLLSYAFNIHRSILVAKKGEVIDQIKVFKGKEDKVTAICEDKLSISVLKGQENKLTKQIRLDKELVAPVRKGDKIGRIVVLKGGRKIAQIDLLAASNIEKASLFDIIPRLFKNFVSELAGVA